MRACGAEGVTMGCLFVMFAALAPRLGVFLIWLARPQLVDAAFDTFIIPLAGIIFLPFTTLMYVVLWSATGLSGFDWVWLFLAFLIDIGGLGASAWGNRDRAGGFYSGGSTG